MADKVQALNPFENVLKGDGGYAMPAASFLALLASYCVTRHD